jgi:hypothetical protein
MKNIKNTFDLSLDIPLYGDINKLNFCNEYELNHYCFYDGDDGESESFGEFGDDAEAETEANEAAAEAAADAAIGMADTEFGVSRADAFTDIGISPTTSDPFAFIMTDVRDPTNVMEIATRAAVLGDPEMDDEEDFGFDIGSVPGTGSQGGLGSLFGFGTPPAKTSMEQVAAQMGMPSYIDAYTQETETYDPGSTHAGASFFGLNTGLGRGYAADMVQQAAPGSFSLTGLATSLADIAVPGLGSLIGLATNQGTNIGAYGNIVEDVFGYDANQTMDDIEDTLSDFGTEIGLNSLGQGLGFAPATSNVEYAPDAGWIHKYKEGGLINLAEGGMPEDNRVSYTRQNIDTSAGRPTENWFNRLDKNTQDYLKGAKGYDEWSTVHGLETLDMGWDDFIEGGAGTLDPMDWGEYGLADQNPRSDPLTGLVYGRGNIEDIRKYNVIDQLVSDVGVARPDMTFDQWGSLDSGLQGIGKPSIEYRKWLRDKTGYPSGLEESDFREEMSPIPSRNINYRVGSVNEQYNAQEGGGIRDLIESQMTLVDVLNTGQAIPPNMGTQQTQGNMNVAQPTAPNQQNVYTQSTQPQSFYAQPQQVKNYGNLY